MPLNPMGSRHIFVDESGDTNIAIGSGGGSNYFVLTAVIVNSERLQAQESAAREIITRFTPKGELKSKHIGSNQERRRKVLAAINNLDFKHYSHVVDKAKIYSDGGLRFSRSFFKFINRQVYDRLFSAFREIHVVADEYGTSEFMKGFVDYLGRHLRPDLFEPRTFQFGASEANPFIQVADIIAGSVLRAYSGKDPFDILLQIKGKTIIVDEWPPRAPEPLTSQPLPRAECLNHLTRTHAVQKAESFIQINVSNQNPEVQAQVAAARYLLYHFRAVDPEEYVTTSRMQEHLSELGFSLSERAIRDTVIGKLRDEGVFIASARHGIKLPFNVNDLFAYADQVSSVVEPYLRRLRQARKHFMLATEGALDIASEERTPELHRLLEEGVQQFTGSKSTA
jgi:hypothetical protein